MIIKKTLKVSLLALAVLVGKVNSSSDVPTKYGNFLLTASTNPNTAANLVMISSDIGYNRASREYYLAQASVFKQEVNFLTSKLTQSALQPTEIEVITSMLETSKKSLDTVLKQWGINDTELNDIKTNLHRVEEHVVIKNLEEEIKNEMPKALAAKIKEKEQLDTLNKKTFEQTMFKDFVDGLDDSLRDITKTQDKIDFLKTKLSKLAPEYVQEKKEISRLLNALQHHQPKTLLNKPTSEAQTSFCTAPVTVPIAALPLLQQPNHPAATQPSQSDKIDEEEVSKKIKEIFEITSNNLTGMTTLYATLAQDKLPNHPNYSDIHNAVYNSTPEAFAKMLGLKKVTASIIQTVLKKEFEKSTTSAQELLQPLAAKPAPSSALSIPATVAPIKTVPTFLTTTAASAQTCADTNAWTTMPFQNFKKLINSDGFGKSNISEIIISCQDGENRKVAKLQNSENNEVLSANIDEFFKKELAPLLTWKTMIKDKNLNPCKFELQDATNGTISIFVPSTTNTQQNLKIFKELAEKHIKEKRADFKQTLNPGAASIYRA